MIGRDIIKRQKERKNTLQEGAAFDIMMLMQGWVTRFCYHNHSGQADTDMYIAPIDSMVNESS